MTKDPESANLGRQ